MKFEDCVYKDVCNDTCRPACMRYVEMKYMLKHSNIPESQQKIHRLMPEQCDIKAFEKLADIQQDIYNFVKQGKTLYIYSPNCGNGKTTWSIKLMLQYFNEMWAGNGFTKRGIFVNVPSFLATCKFTISHPDESFDELRANLPKVDLVIFDDIATTKLTEYEYSLLLTYIDQRVFGEKATIYTGNISPNKLQDYVGNRLASRIVGDNTTKVMLRGKDMR